MKSMKNWRLWGAATAVALAAGGWLWQSNSAAQAPALNAPAQAPVVNTPAEVKAKSHANELSEAFRTASDAILPSVVTIETTQVRKIKGNANPRLKGGENPFKGTPFENFFDEEQLRQFGNQMERQQPRSSGAGSGVIIDAT